MSIFVLKVIYNQLQLLLLSVKTEKMTSPPIAEYLVTERKNLMVKKIYISAKINILKKISVYVIMYNIVDCTLQYIRMPLIGEKTGKMGM